jgi:hypothetical protein
MDNVHEAVSDLSSEIRDQIGDAAFPFTKKWQVISPEALTQFQHDYPDLYCRLMYAIKQRSEAYCPTCNE